MTAPPLDRRAAVARLLAIRGEALVVTGLGAPTYDVAAVGDDPRNFYLWGAMGGASLVGLGLALARPDHAVWVVTGDGELLMGLGALATIARAAPRNLRLLVVDNERYGETGGQRSHTAPAASGPGVDLAGVARACGIVDARAVRAEPELDALAEALARPIEAAGGPLFAAIKVDPAEAPRVAPSRDGPGLARRLREHLARA